MTTEEILALDRLDQAERRVREAAAALDYSPKGWKRLLESIRDDAFVNFQDLIGGDFSTDAYWDEEEGGVDQPLAPGGSPVWWTYVIWRKHAPQDHSFWQGKYAFDSSPAKSKKKKKIVWTSHPPMHIDGGPQDRPSPAKIAASPDRTKASADAIYNKREALSPEDIRKDDEQVLELLLATGVL